MSNRKAYDQDLINLNNTLIQMGQLAQEALANAMYMLSSGSTEQEKLIAEANDNLNHLERDIERQCMILLLRQQPVATDLRKVSTALKVVEDISRIGDFAVDITDILVAMKGSRLDGKALHNSVLEMADHATRMVVNSVTAFSDLDNTLAQQVIEADDEVDREFSAIKDTLAASIATAPELVDCALDYLMIVKYLERLGDHAVSIAEWVGFCVTGVHKNHRIV